MSAEFQTKMQYASHISNAMCATCHLFVHLVRSEDHELFSSCRLLTS